MRTSLSWGKRMNSVRVNRPIRDKSISVIGYDKSAEVMITMLGEDSKMFKIILSSEEARDLAVRLNTYASVAEDRNE